MKNKNENKQEKSCGAILVTKDDKYIIIQHNSGHWDFPKGHVEKDETEEETAMREVKEETGLDCRILKGFRESLNYMIKGKIPKEVVFFVAEVTSNKVQIQEEEIKDYQVLTYDEILKELTYKANRELFIKAIDWYKNTYRTSN